MTGVLLVNLTLLTQLNLQITPIRHRHYLRSSNSPPVWDCFTLTLFSIISCFLVFWLFDTLVPIVTEYFNQWRSKNIFLHWFCKFRSFLLPIHTKTYHLLLGVDYILSCFLFWSDFPYPIIIRLQEVDVQPVTIQDFRIW